jgi:SAM-dependent methyltransferase
VVAFQKSGQFSPGDHPDKIFIKAGEAIDSSYLLIPDEDTLKGGHQTCIPDRDLIMTANDKIQTMDALFFDEYTSQKAILKYTRATAGYGISYLLDHDYKDVYCKALEQLPPEMKADGIRVLEFGCGGGMNLIQLISLLRSKGFKVEKAVGTDFSPVLIESANREAKTYLRESDAHGLEFHVARNEELVSGLRRATNGDAEPLANSFHLIIGVNTIRYCHAAKRQLDCARDILHLLAPGGVCVVIDMNNRYPCFRSDLKNRLRRTKQEQCYVPSLEEYTAPFQEAGFEVLRSEHFCWVPHSGGPTLSFLCKTLTPLLNLAAKSRAMRSLVVSKKPVVPYPCPADAPATGSVSQHL